MKNVKIIFSLALSFKERIILAFYWLFMGEKFYVVARKILDKTKLYRHTKGVWLNPLTSWNERKDILENSMPKE